MQQSRTMRGGSLGIVRAISTQLDVERNDKPPFFRQIYVQIPNSDPGDAIVVVVANTLYFDQLAFTMEDDRLKNNLKDNRRNQCFTFVGENHNFSTRSLQLNMVSIKLWTLCKLLQIKYQSSTAIYLEVDSRYSHSELYEYYGAAINDAYQKHADTILIVNQINDMDLNLEFLHKYNDEQYSIVISKKINKPAALHYNLFQGSQNFANIAYKLLDGREDYDQEGNIIGLVSVDIREEAISNDISTYLYSADQEALINVQVSDFLDFVNGLSDGFQQLIPTKSNIKFHIKTALDRLVIEATDNNNTFFRNLFLYADITREFYSQLLNWILKIITSGKHSEIISILNEKVEDSEAIAIFDMMRNNIEAINSSEHAYVYNDSGDYESLQRLHQSMNGYLTNILLNCPRELEHCTYLSVLRAAISRIVDYNTMASIYKNIFNPIDATYSPDYHMIVNGASHTNFLKHCFSVNVYKYEKLTSHDIQISNDYCIRDLQLFNSAAYQGESFTDVTDMMYPKYKSTIPSFKNTPR